MLKCIPPCFILEFPAGTQSIIPYKTLTESGWEFLSAIESWVCCNETIFGKMEMSKGGPQNHQTEDRLTSQQTTQHCY